jgi:APA family basic amino acid/polyamine antiporter
MSTRPRIKLVRAIGRWSLSALMVNAILGSGIFGLPSIVTHLLGRFGPWAYVAAAAGIGVIAACFAEVSSQFSEAGGPYLYARVTYGRFAGIEIAWLAWLVRLTSGAANANIFVEYLGGFLPTTQMRLGRGLVLLLLIGVLAAINTIGVRAGALLSNVLAAAKIVPLVIFIVAGTLLLSPAAPPVSAATAGLPGLTAWLDAVLLIVFALTGFEAALFPMGEARDARHDAPFALLCSLTVCAVLYILIQVVALRALGVNPGGDRPLAEAARVFLGRGGAGLMQVGALVSVYGNLSAMTLNVPRLTYALAERGDFPSLFGAVSRRFRTPYVSIAVFALGMFLFAVLGTFRGNAVLSAVARLLTYGMVCAALITLRRRQPQADAFRLPGGPLVSGLGVLFVLALLTQMRVREMMVIAAVVVVALLNWLWARRKGPPLDSDRGTAAIDRIATPPETANRS